MTRILEKICVQPTLPIKQAVQVLNDGHLRIALIVDDENRLLGVIADSDIRRAILRGLSFDLPVSEIMVREPVVASVEMGDQAIFSLMQATKRYEIPVLDHDKKVVGLRTIDAFIGQEQQAEVIIMAGGLGTRLRPLTEATPKPLIPVQGKPILFILLDQLILAGFRKITLALNYKANLIKEAIATIPDHANLIHFIEEKKPLGTAGPLSLLASPPVAPFFVVNADLLTNVDFRAMLRFHDMEGNQVTMAVRAEKYQVPFGVVKLKGTHVLGMEEKPIHSYFANAGIYVLDPSVLSFVPENCVYDMPDLINDVIAAGKHVGSFPIHEYWLDIGKHDELQQAQKDLFPMLS